MISSWISRVNAVFLAVGGMVLLFASDNVLPALISGFPAGAAWLGQLLAAALLALAVFTWFNRALLQGGIYGRPVVAANAVFYFVGALSLLRVVMQRNASVGLWILLVPLVVFAAVYSWLLYRGPFERDLAAEKGR